MRTIYLHWSEHECLPGKTFSLPKGQPFSLMRTGLQTFFNTLMDLEGLQIQGLKYERTEDCVTSRQQSSRTVK